MFPPHVAEVLNRFGIAPDTKAVLYELYVAMGNQVLEQFADLCADVPSPATVRPEELAPIRRRVIDRYVRENHPRWYDMTPTPSLWFPRALEGRASGLAVPLGAVAEEGNGFGGVVGGLARGIVGDSQPLPDGMVILGKNAHSGGRIETISFDVVAKDLDDALEISHAEGQQHTIPGSIGETSSSIDAVQKLALIWEIQPNVLKPVGERNRGIRQIYRRHRNWHVITLLAALKWLLEKGFAIFVVQGRAIRWTHELNPAKPVSETIMDLHDRTVRQVIEALGGSLLPVTSAETEALKEAELMNTALQGHTTAHGGAEAIWRVDLDKNTFASPAC